MTWSAPGRSAWINTRSPDLSIDEIVQHLTGPHPPDEGHPRGGESTRCTGFELAVCGPTLPRGTFASRCSALIAVLSGLGVTVLMTSGTRRPLRSTSLQPLAESAFLTDAIIVQRYIEMESRLESGSWRLSRCAPARHSNEIRQFEITDDGLVTGDQVAITTGSSGDGRRGRLAPGAVGRVDR